jgi:hypothetical protein
MCGQIVQQQLQALLFGLRHFSGGLDNSPLHGHVVFHVHSVIKKRLQGKERNSQGQEEGGHLTFMDAAVPTMLLYIF